MNLISKHPIELHAAKARWLQKYLTAKTEAEKQFIKIHAETSLSRIWQHLKNPDMVVGFISGFVNIDSETGGVITPELPIDKQLENLKALIADVKSLGLGYSVVEGAYMGQKERSLIIYGKKENSNKLLEFLKNASNGKTPHVAKLEPKFWQHSFIFKNVDSVDGVLYQRDDISDKWNSFSLGEFSSLDINDIYSKLLKKGQRWKKSFDPHNEKDKATKFRFACAWIGIDNKAIYHNEALIKHSNDVLLDALRHVID